MAFHAFSREDTNCEQEWGQAAPAQPQLPHRLYDGEEDNPEPGLHPKPVLCSGAGGDRQWERACPARDRFWQSPGAVLTPRLFLGLHLLKRCQWRSFSAVCDPHVPGLHFQSSLSPWFVLLCSLGSLTLHTRHCLSSSGCPCASVSVPVQPAPALPTCFCHSFSAETFSLGRSHQSTEQLPELGSVCPAQGAITRAHVGSRISRKKHHPWGKQQKCSLEESF